MIQVVRSYARLMIVTWNMSSEGRRVLCQGMVSDVIISRRGGSKRMRFVLEVARDILEWNKSIGEKSK